MRDLFTVPERLEKLADLYRERNAIYGDDYKRHGDLMMTFFPEGLKLDTVADFNRYGVFKELVTKLSRYAAQWKQGGHVDSLNDQAVFSQMLQELDVEWRELYTIADTLVDPYYKPKMYEEPKPCGAHWRSVIGQNINPLACMECDTSWQSSNKVVCSKSRHIKL